MRPSLPQASLLLRRLALALDETHRPSTKLGASDRAAGRLTKRSYMPSGACVARPSIGHGVRKSVDVRGMGGARGGERGRRTSHQKPRPLAHRCARPPPKGGGQRVLESNEGDARRSKKKRPRSGHAPRDGGRAGLCRRKETDPSGVSAGARPEGRATWRSQRPRARGRQAQADARVNATAQAGATERDPRDRREQRTRRNGENRKGRGRACRRRSAEPGKGTWEGEEKDENAGESGRKATEAEQEGGGRGGLREKERS